VIQKTLVLRFITRAHILEIANKALPYPNMVGQTKKDKDE
jgi:hypothetical protein